MTIRINLAALFLLLSLPTFAQVFVGVNPATLSSQGLQAETQLQTRQLVCEYDFSRSQLSLLLKTQAFSLGATPDQQALLNEVLLMPANRLLQVRIDASSLMLPSGGSYELQSATLPGKFEFNGRVSNVQVQLSNLRLHPQGLSARLQMPFSLSALGLPLEAQYQDQASDQFVLEISTLQLSPR